MLGIVVVLQLKNADMLTAINAQIDYIQVAWWSPTLDQPQNQSRGELTRNNLWNYFANTPSSAYASSARR